MGPTQRVLYDVLEPLSDIYGGEANVRSSSRSSDGILQGDNMNSGSESPIRDEERSLGCQNKKPPLPSRDSLRPCTEGSGWKGAKH